MWLQSNHHRGHSRKPITHPVEEMSVDCDGRMPKLPTPCGERGVAGRRARPGVLAGWLSLLSTLNLSSPAPAPADEFRGGFRALLRGTVPRRPTLAARAGILA